MEAELLILDRIQRRQLNGMDSFLEAIYSLAEEDLPVDTARKEKRKTVTIMEEPND